MKHYSARKTASEARERGKNLGNRLKALPADLKFTQIVKVIRDETGLYLVDAIMIAEAFLTAAGRK